MKNQPARNAACTRGEERHRLLESSANSIELDLGRGIVQCEILDLSTGGVCFGLHDESALPEPGAVLEPALMRVKGVEIRGRLIIAHVTDTAFSGSVCGARFEPLSRDDARALTAVVRKVARSQELDEP